MKTSSCRYNSSIHIINIIFVLYQHTLICQQAFPYFLDSGTGKDRAGLQVLENQIEPSPEQEMAPGKAHNLTDLLPVFRLVAVFGTVFTFRFRIHGTTDPF